MADISDDWLAASVGKVPGPFGFGLSPYVVAQPTMADLLDRAGISQDALIVDLQLDISGGGIEAKILTEQIAVVYYPTGAVIRGFSSADPGRTLIIPNVPVDPTQAVVVCDLENLPVAVKAIPHGTNPNAKPDPGSGVSQQTFGDKVHDLLEDIGKPLGVSAAVIATGAIIFVLWELGAFRSHK